MDNSHIVIKLVWSTFHSLICESASIGKRAANSCRLPMSPPSPRLACYARLLGSIDNLNYLGIYGYTSNLLVKYQGQLNLL